MLNKLIIKRMNLIKDMSEIGIHQKNLNPNLTFHDFLNLSEIKPVYQMFLSNMTDFLTQGDGGLILIQSYNSPQYQSIIGNKTILHYKMSGLTQEDLATDYIKYLDYYVWKCNNVQIKTFEFVKDLFFEKCGYNLVTYLLNEGQNSAELVEEFKSMKDEAIVKEAISIHNELIDDLNGLLHNLDRAVFQLYGFEIPSYEDI